MTSSYKVFHPSGRVSWFVLDVHWGGWFCMWREVRPHKVYYNVDRGGNTRYI